MSQFLEPSALTPAVIQAGASVGVDVDGLRKKYLKAKLAQVTHEIKGETEEELANRSKRDDADRMRELEARGADLYTSRSGGVAGGGEGGATSVDAKLKAAAHASTRLDRLKMCPRCGGQGLHKVHYNYQVKDVNCETCEGQGLLYRDDRGQMVKQSEAPQPEPKAYVVEGIAEAARELAQNCGISSGGGGDLEETMKRNFAIDNLDAPPPPM